MTTSERDGAPGEARDHAPAAATRSRRGRVDARELFELVLLMVALLANDRFLPRQMFGDGYDRFVELDLLLRRGSLTASRYSIIGPLFAAPLWWLGDAAGGYAGAMAETQRYNPIVFGLGVIALYFLLRRRMDGQVLRAFVILLALASMFPFHLTQFYGEVFTAMLVAVGLTAATLATRGRGRFAGWALAALGVANTPATLLALALVTGQRVWASRRLRYLLAALAAAALIVAESALRRGGLFTSGYEQDVGVNPSAALVGGWLPGFNYPFLLGLLALLMSFGKGLIFYAPGLFLPLRARLRALGASGAALARVHTGWLIFTGGLLLIYASWWDWSGDWFWGPRFLLFASVPASFALAYWTQRPAPRLALNLLALLALALSVWAGIDGGVFGQNDMNACFTYHYPERDYCRFIPDYSALWRPFVNLIQYGPGQRFATIEGLTGDGVMYGLICVAIALYLALPLLGAIRAQLVAQASQWTSVVRERFSAIRM